MIRVQEIVHLLKLAVYSSYIESERPVSVILIAPPEHGKTELLKTFAFIDSISIQTDFNTFTFSEFAMQYPKKKTIIIPDFLRVVKKKHSVSSNALSIISAVTEEGWIGKLPLGQIIEKPIIANFLTALTTDELNDKRHKWTKTGFLSRFLPISFSYSEKTKQQIREYIKDRMYNKEEPANFKIEHQRQINLPIDIANKIEEISLDISEKNNILGFRLQRQLQVLTMANAFSNERSLVSMDDYKEIKHLSRFINFNFSEV